MSPERSGRRREQVDIVVHDCMRASCDTAKCTRAPHAGAALEQENLAVGFSCSSTSSECMPASARCSRGWHQDAETAPRGPNSSCTAAVVPCIDAPIMNCSKSSAASLISLLKPKQSTEEEEQEDAGGCTTPKVREQRIPNPPTACPPPPHKKRRKLIKHSMLDMIDRTPVEATSTAASPSDEPTSSVRQRTGPSFFSAPSDLHTYPEIIRALFKS